MNVTRRKLLAASSALLLPSLLAHGQEAEKAGDSEANSSSKAPEQTTFNEFTPQSERGIRRGDEWLMKTMHRDGGCGVDIGQPTDIGCTAMVGLALMSQGNTPVEGPRSREVQRILSFLLRATDNMPQDDITSVVGTQLQNKIGRHAHSFFAATFLAEVIGEGWDTEPVRDALKKVVTAIVGSQSASGNWGDQSWAPMLGTVMGWVSLRAAHMAGMKVGGSPDLTAKHLVQQMQTQLAQQQQSWMHTLYKNATGIRVLYALGMDDDPVAKKGFRRRGGVHQAGQHGLFAGRRRGVSGVPPDHRDDAPKGWRRLGDVVSHGAGQDRRRGKQRRELDRPPLHHQPHVLHGGGDPGAQCAQSVSADLAGVRTLNDQ